MSTSLSCSIAQPSGIAIAPNGATAFVADSGSKDVTVLLRRDNAIVRVDVATGHVGTAVTLGTSPYTVAL